MCPLQLQVGAAASDHDAFARDVGRIVTGEEQCRQRNLLRRPPAPHRNILRNVVAALGCDAPRHHHIHAPPTADIFVRCCSAGMAALNVLIPRARSWASSKIGSASWPNAVSLPETRSHFIRMGSLNHSMMPEKNLESRG